MPPPRAIPLSMVLGADGRWYKRSRGTAAKVPVRSWAEIVEDEFRAAELLGSFGAQLMFLGYCIGASGLLPDGLRYTPPWGPRLLSLHSVMDGIPKCSISGK